MTVVVCAFWKAAGSWLMGVATGLPLPKAIIVGAKVRAASLHKVWKLSTTTSSPKNPFPRSHSEIDLPDGLPLALRKGPTDR